MIHNTDTTRPEPPIDLPRLREEADAHLPEDAGKILRVEADTYLRKEADTHLRGNTDKLHTWGKKRGTHLREEANAHRGANADDGVDLAQPHHRQHHEGQQLVREELKQEEQDAHLVQHGVGFGFGVGVGWCSCDATVSEERREDDGRRKDWMRILQLERYGILYQEQDKTAADEPSGVYNYLANHGSGEQRDTYRNRKTVCG